MNEEEIIRILALKNNLNSKNSRIAIERIPEKYLNDGIKLTIDVFNNEQNIPKELIPLDKTLKPIWWGARVGDDIIGVAAAWKENDKWHWGRFAVDKRFRGIGIGEKIAVFSLEEIFNSDINEIYSEARDVTVKMLMKFGGKITGEAENFYGEPVTPITLSKGDFMESFMNK